MTRRDSQLRAKRFSVEDLGRRMATLDVMRADLERKLSDLEESVARERQRAGDSEIGRLAFPSFLQSIENRRSNIQNSLQEIERKRANYQSEFTTAFQELKTFEQALEHDNMRALQAQGRRAQSRVNELALLRHLRKHSIRQT